MLFIDPVGLWHSVQRALCIPPFQRADRGDLGRTQATSAGAALPTISNHLVETLKGRKKKACVQHSEDLLLRLCSQQQRLQQCFPVQRRPDGDGVVAVGVGGGAASASASEPAFFSLLQLGPTTLGTMAILAMAMATLTPTATHRMHTHTLTVMGIAAFTPVMGITRAIDTEVTTLTAEPIIDTRATILIAGRGGRLTQRQLNDAERPPTGGLSFCKMFRRGPGVGVLPLGHAHE